MSKKGAIELSVNAIVVFVIALGMLGVGWFMIGKLKDLGGAKIDEVFSIDQLQNQPSAQDPIVFDDDIKIKFDSETKLKGGFYNVQNVDAGEAVFNIKNCRDTIGNDVCPSDFCDFLPTVVSSATTVAPSKGYGFNILIKHKGSEVNIPTGTYVCEFVVETRDDHTKIWESKSVFVNVVS